MTGEKKNTVAVTAMIVSAIILLVFVILAVWNVQHDEVGLAWLYGLLAVAPLAVMYEILRRWNRV